MTEEERLRQLLMAQALGQPTGPTTLGGHVDQAMAAPVPEGMMSQSSVDPRVAAMRNASRDLSGQQAAINSQRQFGQSLLASKAPGVKMYGNVAAGPNWAEALAHGVDKGMGAYNIAKARSAQEALNQEQAGIDTAKGDVAAGAYQDQRSDKEAAQDLGERTLQEKITGREETNALRLTTAGLTNATRRQIAQDQATAKAETERQKREDRLKQSRDPATFNIPGQEEPVLGYFEEGIAKFANGDPMPEGATVKPQVTRSSGSGGQYVKEQDAYGNAMYRIFDKEAKKVIGETQFFDGTPYTEEEAIRRGREKASQKGREKHATDLAAGKVELAENAYESIQALNSVIGHLDTAYSALEEGASSGRVMSYLPTLTDATTKLEYARDSIAMKGISEHTFGSLSTSEAQWLRDVSIPDLTPEELMPWIDKRREAIKRMVTANSYVQDMTEANLKPDQKVIDDILRRNGFKWSN